MINGEKLIFFSRRSLTWPKTLSLKFISIKVSTQSGTGGGGEGRHHEKKKKIKKKIMVPRGLSFPLPDLEKGIHFFDLSLPPFFL